MEDVESGAECLLVFFLGWLVSYDLMFAGLGEVVGGFSMKER